MQFYPKFQLLRIILLLPVSRHVVWLWWILTQSRPICSAQCLPTYLQPLLNSLHRVCLFSGLLQRPMFSLWTDAIHSWLTATCHVHCGKQGRGSVPTVRSAGTDASSYLVKVFQVTREDTESLLNCTRIFGWKEPLTWMWMRAGKAPQRIGSQGMPSPVSRALRTARARWNGSPAVAQPGVRMSSRWVEMKRLCSSWGKYSGLFTDGPGIRAALAGDSISVWGVGLQGR